MAKLPELLNPMIIQDEPDDEKIAEAQYHTEFTARDTNLHRDIHSVEIKMSELQKYITGIDVQLNQIKEMIKNERDNKNRARLYRILNESMDLMVKYQNLYLQSMDIKFKYRKEQDDLTHKKVRFTEVEIKKVGVDESDLSVAKLFAMIRGLQSTIDNPEQQGQIFDSMTDLIEEDKYKL